MSTVIQVVQHLRPGGIETMALDLASFAREHEKHLIVSLEGNRKQAITQWPRLAPYASQLIFLEKGSGLKPALIFRLAGLFRKIKADVVHTHHIGPLLYAGLASRLAGVKRLIHTEHDAWHLHDPHRRTLQRWAIKFTHPRLVADARTVANAMKQWLHQDDIYIVHNGIDTERFKPGDQAAARNQLGLPAHVKLVGCSGRLEEVKGQHVLIDALANMPYDTHLALAGDGSAKDALRRQTQTEGLSDRVHFLGHLDDMPSFYQALDVFCLPSFNEGLPLSPLEAQACGIPTVVTDVGGAREALCLLSGKLIPSGDVGKMANALNITLRQRKYGFNIDPRHFIKHQRDVRLMVQAYTDLHHPGV